MDGIGGFERVTKYGNRWDWAENKIVGTGVYKVSLVSSIRPRFTTNDHLWGCRVFPKSHQRIEGNHRMSSNVGK